MPVSADYCYIVRPRITTVPTKVTTPPPNKKNFNRYTSTTSINSSGSNNSVSGYGRACLVWSGSF